MWEYKGEYLEEIPEGYVGMVYKIIKNILVKRFFILQELNKSKVKRKSLKSKATGRHTTVPIKSLMNTWSYLEQIISKEKYYISA
jgi:hypothetical protein